MGSEALGSVGSLDVWGNLPQMDVEYAEDAEFGDILAVGTNGFSSTTGKLEVILCDAATQVPVGICNVRDDAAAYAANVSVDFSVEPSAQMLSLLRGIVIAKVETGLAIGDTLGKDATGEQFDLVDQDNATASNHPNGGVVAILLSGYIDTNYAYVGIL